MDIFRFAVVLLYSLFSVVFCLLAVVFVCWTRLIVDLNYSSGCFDMLGLCLRFYIPVYGLEIHTTTLKCCLQKEKSRRKMK
jgi:hypothetical protein